MGIRKLLRILGPGLLYAGAAIGVSHLVQSTRAGAGYGFDLIWILLLANILKYPFFEFAPRYAAATGESLIQGYHRLGRWAIIAFAILTVATMFTIQAAVTVVTAGIFANVFHLSVNTVMLSALILTATVIILMVGKYSVLDKLIKIVIIILALSTVVAVVSALSIYNARSGTEITHFNWSSETSILFLIAFIGWMPAPIDVSVWSSLWNIEKARTLKERLTLRETLLDFRIGYIGTAIMALCFLLLGALVMHGSGESLSSEGAAFAGQLINMYTVSIGEWARPVIALAALTTMFSTTLTCIDAYPRVLLPTTRILAPKIPETKSIDNKLYWLWILVVSAGALILLRYFATSMHYMVDVATTLSFVTAPVLAWMNYRVVKQSNVPANARPGMGLRIWSWFGIVFLSLFTVYYILWRMGILLI